jgi:tetratricopeptide (TPR) repeat protein
MTPKQQERIINKIKKIKAALAADKRFWGGQYHDGQGLRYMPVHFYLQLNDFTGGLRYLNWFNKHFPNDSGSPIFFFECAIIYFKTGRTKEAETIMLKVFRKNIFLIDRFLGKELIDCEKYDGLESLDYVLNYFTYSRNQDYLTDFYEWLDGFVSTEKFILFKSQHEKDSN